MLRCLRSSCRLPLQTVWSAVVAVSAALAAAFAAPVLLVPDIRRPLGDPSRSIRRD
jgi:hypothetical protein